MRFVIETMICTFKLAQVLDELNENPQLTGIRDLGIHENLFMTRTQTIGSKN